MFRLQLFVQSSEEARQALADFDRLLELSELPEMSKNFLRDQIFPTLQQIDKQLLSPSSRAFRSDRTIEGPGYMVTIKARQASGGLLKALKQLLSR